MKNIEKYKNIVLDHMSICDIDTELRRKCTKESRAFCEGLNCQGCEERFLKWLLEEAKEPVLDDVERKYLAEVIKPFRKHVTGIRKCFEIYYYKICISLDDGENAMSLPSFPLDSEMYKNMDSKKWYNLEELGL